MIHSRLLTALLAAAPLSALAASIPLYPTGPSEDSAFLRFVNASSGTLELVAAGSGATLALDGDSAASNFLVVPAGKPVQGTLTRGKQQHALDVTVEPGEFVTVVGLAGPGEAMEVRVVREQADDFSALKASLAFYNLDGSCENATLNAAGRDVAIFKAVELDGFQRRLINPLNLSVQLLCGGQPVGEPLALGQLEAGERYSVMLAPSANGSRLFQARDTVAN
ncbi:alginate O-acetyltransferase AlgF [Stutzerimonas chloritidismutans]|uniref:Alginate biosynthesis protein AlgF n=1 Tax=Stutzerimonas chloritidismutans TaxID=203192 RepID=A0ABU9M2L2_STUCH